MLETNVSLNYRSRFKGTPNITEARLQEINSTLSKEIIETTLDEIKAETPVEKGNLVNSIRVKEIEETNRGLVDARYVAKIGSDLEYSIYPEVGARPSRGRFLPGPVKRISRFKYPDLSIDIGIHPGQVGQRYFERGLINAEERVAFLVEDTYEREYANAVAKMTDKALRQATRSNR